MALQQRGLHRVPASGPAPDIAELGPEPVETTTFDRVGGMAAIKHTIHRMIIVPRSRPELFRGYGRRTGGGILLYGPPGCGKTLLARATAGECGLPFFNVRIEDVADRSWVSASATCTKRSSALVCSRQACSSSMKSTPWLSHGTAATGAPPAASSTSCCKRWTIGAENRDLLVLATTNAPWDVDQAVLRPGRFDRTVFVPPPDEQARREVLSVLIRDVHTEEVDINRIAAATPLFGGADLRAAVELAVDVLIDVALDTGEEPPLSTERVLAAAEAVRPTTIDWLHRARNYVEFANESGRWSDVEDYLKQREVRRRLSR